MGVEEPAPAAAPAPAEEPVPVEEPKQPSIDDAVSAIEKSAARLQADDGLKLDMPDDTTSYRPKKHKLENTQPFTF